MCGIVGVISAYKNGFTAAEQQLFQDMLYADTLRGVDSTGAFLVSTDGVVDVLKDAVPGFQFLATNEFKSMKAAAYMDGIFMVGHNRAATRGTVKPENAHPFVVDNELVLVQNGTYNGDHSHLSKTEVDTEAIAQLLHRETDIEKALAQVDAAYALVWYDVRIKTLYIVRNTQRPMYIARTKNGGVVFASEPGIIQFAAGRASVDLQDDPYLIKEGCLCAFTLNDNGTYASEYKEINYQYKGVSRSYSFTGRSGSYSSSSSNVTNFHAPNATSITQTIHEILREQKINDMFTNPQIMSVTKNFKRGDSVVIEIVDFAPANKRNDCKMFYVIGNTVETNGPGIPVHFTLEGTMEEVYAKTQGMYCGEIDYESSQINQDVSPTGATPMYTFSMRVKNTKPLNTQVMQ